MKEFSQAGVFEEKGRIYTLNLVPGKRVYGEVLVKEGEREVRSWEPMRSKLAAALLKGARLASLRRDSCVLYLGAATGTTVSHVSDICGKGLVFAVEFSPEVFSELFLLSRLRKNIVPLFCNAASPQQYYFRLLPVDLVYQDIAQRNQVEIFEENCRLFLKRGGQGMLCVKARSIDVGSKPQRVFQQVRERLAAGFRILGTWDIGKFQRDHMVFLVERK